MKRQFETAREWFDELCRRSRTGLFPARNKLGDCVYRDGCRACVAGVLIPDEMYDPRLEGKTANDLWGAFPFQSDGIPELTKDFGQLLPEGVWVQDVSAAQCVHDVNMHRRHWDHTQFVALLVNNVPCFNGFTENPL